MEQSAKIIGIKKEPYEVDGRKGNSYYLVIEFGGLPFSIKVKPQGGTEAVIELLLKQFESEKK